MQARDSGARVGRGGIEADRVAIRLDGEVEIADRLGGEGRLVARNGVVGPESERLLVVLERLAGLAAPGGSPASSRP
jgi:hypothetical protein